VRYTRPLPEGHARELLVHVCVHPTKERQRRTHVKAFLAVFFDKCSQRTLQRQRKIDSSLTSRQSRARASQANSSWQILPGFRGFHPAQTIMWGGPYGEAWIL
jgi:hypothetical protein